jgi:hypothetical protein
MSSKKRDLIIAACDELHPVGTEPQAGLRPSENGGDQDIRPDRGGEGPLPPGAYAKIRDEKNNAIKGNLLQLAGLLAQALGIGALFMSCGYDVRTIWPELLMAVPLLICGTVTLRAGTQALAGAKPRDW